MNRNCLYYIAAALWGIPGVIITIKGISAYLTMPSRKLWWLLLITIFVMVSFFLMFRKIVDRYSARIAAEFTASFYSGLGPMLVFAACRFISNRKQI